MDTTKEGIKVQPGQIWRDLDTRMGNRLMVVQAVESGYAYLLPLRKFGNGPDKMTRLLVRRMHKHSSGWRREENDD